MIRTRAHIPLALAALLLAAPVQAGGDDGADAGKPLLPSEEELRALGELAGKWMQDLAVRLLPMVEKLQALVDDIDAYEPPVMLPNGDIIIRRKPPAETGDEDVDEDAEIAL